MHSCKHGNRTQTTLFLRGQNRFASQFSANHIQFPIAKLRFCIANCDAIPDKFIPVSQSELPFQISELPTANETQIELPLPTTTNNHFELKSTAIKRVRQYVLKPIEQLVDLKLFLNDTHDKTANVISRELHNGPVKTNISVQIDLRDTPNGSTEQTNPHPYFANKTEAILRPSQITDFLKNAYSTIERAHEAFIQRGSGWRNHRIIQLRLDFARYQPLRGSSYIDLPPVLKNKKSDH